MHQYGFAIPSKPMPNSYRPMNPLQKFILSFKPIERPMSSRQGDNSPILQISCGTFHFTVAQLEQATEMMLTLMQYAGTTKAVDVRVSTYTNLESPFRLGRTDRYW